MADLSYKTGRPVCETYQMEMRELARDELELYWTIDRREIHHNVYRMVDRKLVLTPHCFDIPGWATTSSDELYACFDRGGTFFGMFDGDQLVGASAVGGVPFGPKGDHLELQRLHVSRDYRGNGIGTRLFEAARSVVLDRGVAWMYVSATPTENTVNFYLHRGCQLANPPDPELLAKEPEDIHLVCRV